MKTLFLLGIFSMSLNALAASYIRVANHSNYPVMAIWQAGGCLMIAEDPQGESQFTVCHLDAVKPQYETRYNFGWWMADRSVKVWGANGERIGYCNSFDDETLTVTGTTSDDQKVTGC